MSDAKVDASDSPIVVVTEQRAYLPEHLDYAISDSLYRRVLALRILLLVLYVVIILLNIFSQLTSIHVFPKSGNGWGGAGSLFTAMWGTAIDRDVYDRLLQQNRSYIGVIQAFAGGLTFLAVVLSALMIATWVWQRSARQREETEYKTALYARNTQGAVADTTVPFHHPRTGDRPEVLLMVYERREQRRIKLDTDLGISAFSMLAAALAFHFASLVAALSEFEYDYEPSNGCDGPSVPLCATAMALNVVCLILAGIPAVTGVQLCCCCRRVRPERSPPVLMYRDQDQQAAVALSELPQATEKATAVALPGFVMRGREGSEPYGMSAAAGTVLACSVPGGSTCAFHKAAAEVTADADGAAADDGAASPDRGEWSVASST